ncbi:ECF transporter S component [Dehalobacterium formicoaceticum]|uniref:ECF transporter S component n=1 Tax=Dehalobacterium formicoaceticum TaxID=51515 RepID=A0ABT1Y3W7_9FIRM|nr:ECF transporter S component [Dehalobacterium formicoaceticum]MCR6544840.1 ECF transporter S component [Dehalobacterium formicoaceticum]
MKKNLLPLVSIILMALLLLLSTVPETPFYGINWALFSLIIVGMALLTFFLRFEQQGVSSKVVALTAAMASLAAIARVPFAVIMSLQPTTFLVMISGYVFGPQTGFMVGALGALTSNFFLGQGPWTPWQMFSWGMCGVSGALLGMKSKGYKPVSFALLGFVNGYLFGWVMNLWHWLGFIYPLTWETFLATYAISFPFDTIHAVGNVAFSLVFGKSFYHILSRFKKKMVISFNR